MSWSTLTVNAFLRQARAADPEDPASILLALQAGAYTVAATGDGQVISATANGKSVSIGVGAGLTKQDILEITETALGILERGGTYASSRAIGRFR